MRISLLLFIIGSIFIIIGISYQISPSNKIHREIEFVPRPVYDELVMSSILK